MSTIPVHGIGLGGIAVLSVLVLIVWTHGYGDAAASSAPRSSDDGTRVNRGPGWSTVLLTAGVVAGLVAAGGFALGRVTAEASGEPSTTPAPAATSAPVAPAEDGDPSPVPTRATVDESRAAAAGTSGGEAYAIGDLVEVSGATITVDVVTSADSFETVTGEVVTVADDESLWVFGTTVTNTGNDAIYPDGQVIGDAWVTVKDTEGRDLALLWPNSVLPGNSRDALLTGQTHAMTFLMRGVAGSAPGHLVLESGGAPTVIALQEGLQAPAGG